MRHELLVEECESLEGEVCRIYRNMPWTLNNDHVGRLKRQVHRLTEDALAAQDCQSTLLTQLRLRGAVFLVHECVALAALCLRKNLLSPGLHGGLIKRLRCIDGRLRNALSPETVEPLADPVA
jgi:hypothetical protein